MFGKSSFSSRPYAGNSNYYYAQALSVLSTSVVSIQRFINKYVNLISETTIIVLTEIALHLVALSKIVTSNVTISKFISKTINYAVTSASSLIKSITKTLSVLSTSASTIIKSINKTISYMVTETIYLIKYISKTFSISSTTTDTLISVNNAETVPFASIFLVASNILFLAENRIFA